MSISACGPGGLAGPRSSFTHSSGACSPWLLPLFLYGSDSAPMAPAAHVPPSVGAWCLSMLRLYLWVPPSPSPACSLSPPPQSEEKNPSSHLKNISHESSPVFASQLQAHFLFWAPLMAPACPPLLLPNYPALSSRLLKLLGLELLCCSACGPHFTLGSRGTAGLLCLLPTTCLTRPLPTHTWMPAPSGTMIFHTQLRLLR